MFKFEQELSKYDVLGLETANHFEKLVHYTLHKWKLSFNYVHTRSITVRIHPKMKIQMLVDIAEFLSKLIRNEKD